VGRPQPSPERGQQRRQPVLLLQRQRLGGCLLASLLLAAVARQGALRSRRPCLPFPDSLLLLLVTVCGRVATRLRLVPAMRAARVRRIGWAAALCAVCRILPRLLRISSGRVVEVCDTCGSPRVCMLGTR
jgi:hypothetical protein